MNQPKTHNRSPAEPSANVNTSNMALTRTPITKTGIAELPRSLHGIDRMIPPSTRNAAPVMADASSDARNMTRFATSVG